MDEDGCNCIRCRTERYDVQRRDSVDVLVWSFSLFRRYPSILFLFGLIAAAAVFAPVSAGGVGVFVGALVGRGYVNLCAADDLGKEDTDIGDRMVRVVRKLPTVSAALFVSVVIGGVVALLFAAPALIVLENAGLDNLVTVSVALGVLVLVAVFVLLLLYAKFLLVHEACFIGDGGPVSSVRKSWGVVRLRRVKIVLVAGSFSVIIGLLVFGFEDGGGALRTVASVGTTAVYSAVFSHLYVERTL